MAAHDYRLVRQARAPVQPTEADPVQAEVIRHDRGPLLVLAGPGTGKTATIVDSVVERIAHRGVDPESILVLTFSRRAATELRERITARLDRTTREPMARTFHSYAFGLLRARAVLRGEQPPRLLSGPEQDLVIRELLRGDADLGGTRWPSELRPALTTRGFAEELRDLLLRAVERGIEPVTLDEMGQQWRRSDWRAAASFLQEYADVTALSGSQAYDPAELIRAAVDALTDDSELLRAERSRRRRIFVDEYQDTDPAQESLLRILSTGADELVVVGDPDQSIYGFRGADSAGIRRFPEEYDAPTVALSTSRRAGANLLAASRRVAARLSGPTAHRSLAPAPGLIGGRPEVVLLRTPSEEATYVAHRLRAAHLRDGMAWSDMAVLVRSTVRTLPQLRRALLAAGVPLAVGGDDLPLADQPAVAPLLLLLRCAIDSDFCTEEIAVELVGSPYGGADALALRRLRRALRALDIETGGDGTTELIREAVLDPRVLLAVPPHVSEPARRIASLLESAHENADESVEDVLWAVWSTADIAADWERASARGGQAGAAADRDLDAVVALFDVAARYVDRVPGGTLRGFLDHLAGQQIPGDSLAPRAEVGDAVRVLTAHAAKGLQWPLVVVAGVQEGGWPDLRQRGSVLGSEMLVDVAAGHDPRTLSTVAPLLDEERRLFYVAVTRASRSLVVTAVRGDEVAPSRFLDELDSLPAGRDRRFAVVPRTLALPALVAELRQVVTDASVRRPRREAAARQLARLAAAGVPGADPLQWWGYPELSDDAPLVVGDEQVVVSPSQVERFDTCELRWLLETVGATFGISLPQTVGTIVHDLAAWIATESPAAQEIADRLDGELDRLDLGPAWISGRQRERAHTMIAKLSAWVAQRGSVELVGAEIDFTVPVAESALLRGRVDRLERDADGRLVVVDFKTGRSQPRDDDIAHHPQLGAYQIAVEAGGFEAGDEPGGAALVQLGTNAKAHKEQKQPPPEDEWARDLVTRTATGMGGAVFRAIPGQACSYCPARISCPAQPEGGQVGTS